MDFTRDARSHAVVLTSAGIDVAGRIEMLTVLGEVPFDRPVSPLAVAEPEAERNDIGLGRGSGRDALPRPDILGGAGPCGGATR
jgi:hypothetical protein